MTIFWSIIASISLLTPAQARVRKVEVPKDRIVTVKTALGIATIIQVPAPPSSIVVGDSSAFKVEYLDQAITIKPLRSGAKSNLYIYTDWRRFNVQLSTGAEGGADYVVYLEEPAPKSSASSLRWLKVGRSLANEGVTLSIRRVARTENGRLLLEFSVASSKSEKFDPKWIWLTQKGKARPIQSLFLSQLEVSPQSPGTGTIEVLAADIDLNVPLLIELRRKKTASLSLPKAAAWK